MEIGDRARGPKSIDQAGTNRREGEVKASPEPAGSAKSAVPGDAESPNPPGLPRAVLRSSGGPGARASFLSRASASEILSLQRSIGNRALLRMVGQLKNAASPHSISRRHSAAAATPSEDGSSTRTAVTSPRFGRTGVAVVQRDAARPRSQSAFGRASVLESVGTSLQRKGEGGKAGGGRSVAFDKREIPADGVATSQAKARGFGAATVDWDTVGNAFGSKIDKSGLVTAGKNLPSKAKVITVKAVSTKDARAAARGWITLWEEKLFKAKLDYKDFVKGSPYELQNFTAGANGKFDVKYFAVSRRLDVYVRVKYDCPFDAPVAGESPKKARARERRWAKLAKTFKSIVTKAWSGRYSFMNVREPKEVWGKLNPVRVVLNVVDVALDKKVKAAPHFTVELDPANQTSQRVGGGVAHLGPDLGPEKSFNPEAKEGELARLQPLIPQIKFPKGSRTIPGGDADQLKFLATYLKRIRVPRYTLLIEGSATDETVPWKIRHTADSRAEEVRRALRRAGLTYHMIRLGRKANDTTVTITPKVSDKFTNWYDVTSHEFGHMIGLDDEYSHGYFKDAAGNNVWYKNPFTGKMGWKKAWETKTSEYGAVETALGKDYAEKTQKLFVPKGDPNDPARAQEVEETGTSIMSAGKDVRMQHYVTFWEALAQVTAQKANVPNPKFGQDAWKFVGG